VLAHIIDSRGSQINRICHIKCYEAKPICARCRQFDHKCEGYGYGSPSTNLPSSSRSLHRHLCLYQECIASSEHVVRFSNCQAQRPKAAKAGMSLYQDYIHSLEWIQIPMVVNPRHLFRPSDQIEIRIRAPPQRQVPTMNGWGQMIRVSWDRRLSLGI
jgi:hypothetical protein